MLALVKPLLPPPPQPHIRQPPLLPSSPAAAANIWSQASPSTSVESWKILPWSLDTAAITADSIWESSNVSQASPLPSNLDIAASIWVSFHLPSPTPAFGEPYSNGDQSCVTPPIDQKLFLPPLDSMGHQNWNAAGVMHPVSSAGKAMRDAQVVQQMVARSAATSTPQTISPKDAMLEFYEPEGDAMLEFYEPEGDAMLEVHEPEGDAMLEVHEPEGSSAAFNPDAISRVAAAQSQQVFGGLPVDAGFNSFLAATKYCCCGIRIEVGTEVAEGIDPFFGQRPQSAVPSVSDVSTRLGSVDTGATESVHSGTPQRPLDTRADGGTYTCTYHGCTLRFDTPALLQKHKREGHRQAHGLNGARRPDTTGMTLALLNTQSGPHRCDRINPSTGKPCNAVFSRPYDLTRHEDTIHNDRKQKVRCDLCTDEKTFRRADSLTRHNRVCHPDVEFPGKQRRRGGHSM